MTDNEKIINGIVCCTERHDCADCEYFRTDDIDGNCIDHLLKDAKKRIEELESERLEWISAVSRLTAENELLKEQEVVKPTWSRGKPFCGACGLRIRSGGKFCSECGKQIAWGERVK